jgi:hypothetical protein
VSGFGQAGHDVSTRTRITHSNHHGRARVNLSEFLIFHNCNVVNGSICLKIAIHDEAQLPGRHTTLGREPCNFPSMTACAENSENRLAITQRSAA